MEKRLLLAFALSMAVFFVYTEFFAPRPVVQPTPPADAPEQVTELEQPALPTEPSVARPAEMEEHDVAEELVTIESDRVQAVFSTTRGLQHWYLKHYRVEPDPDEPLVDLGVSPTVDSSLGLAILPDAEGVPFVLEASTDSSLELLARHNDLVEQRRWNLEGYQANLNWRVENTSDTPIVISPMMVVRDGINYDEVSMYHRHSPILARGSEIERPKERDVESEPSYGSVSWVGVDQQYFLKAAVPREFSRDNQGRIYPVARAENVMVVASELTLPRQVIRPGESWSTTIDFYMGPKRITELRTVDPRLEEAVNLGFFGWLARPLLALLNFFYGIIGNYGVAIILVTVIIKIIFYPLTKKSFTSMKAMQRVAPKLEEIKKKYEKDPERRNKEMMNLYRTEGVNPLGGCLPILLQIPVFFALYQVLLYSIELRHAPFMLWITDLSAPEDLFALALGGFELPIRLLPLIMGASMVLQQKMMPTTMDKMQQQIMMLMPIIFTFIFWGFPSGLVLYWLVNNLLTIGQQWWIGRGMKVAE